MAEKTKNLLTLPIIAMRGQVIFPNNLTNFDLGRDKSINALNKSASNDMLIFVSMQIDSAKEEITENDLYKIGTVLKIKQILKLNTNLTKINVQGLYRAKIVAYRDLGDYAEVDIRKLSIKSKDDQLEEAYFRVAKETIKELLLQDTRISRENLPKNDLISNPDEYVNFFSYLTHFKVEDKQKLLECNDVIQKLQLFEKLAKEEIEIIKIERKIGAMVRDTIEKSQKEFFLREQIKAIHTELGDDEEEQEILTDKIISKKMPKEIEEKALKEIKRMDKMNPASPELTIIRTYLDWLIDLPWNEKTVDNDNLKQAIESLNNDHYGLENVKKRITEFLAVLKLTKSLHAPILCFVGPPGVGKTSIAKSVAKALNRNFVRMSLGGVKDESEIRGHRRTYIGAMPGRIIYSIKNAGSNNPVFLLDEIDKLSNDMRGDPASALLEVLDPEQNSTFRDRFLEVPYDLSNVLFIATANSIDGIPLALLDRMELIEINGYSLEEKIEIAKRFLISKNIVLHGLKPELIKIENDALISVIENYTLEAGVRSLEKQIANICRKVACDFAENDNDYLHVVTKDNITEYLGIKKYIKDELKEDDEVGAATGLAWTSVGGTILTIEVLLMKGKGEIVLTGKLGDVMKESARAAISYIKANAKKYNVDFNIFEENDIHIHVPEGATPKDGPSAGITIATAILSAITKKKIKKDVAMTGEITLRGKVLPIGGLKEKVLAAYRMGINNIIIPLQNKKDMEEIPENIKSKINFILANNVEQVFISSINNLYDI